MSSIAPSSDLRCSRIRGRSFCCCSSPPFRYSARTEKRVCWPSSCCCSRSRHSRSSGGCSCTISRRRPLWRPASSCCPATAVCRESNPGGSGRRPFFRERGTVVGSNAGRRIRAAAAADRTFDSRAGRAAPRHRRAGRLRRGLQRRGSRSRANRVGTRSWR